jgi:hypothetical protein
MTFRECISKAKYQARSMNYAAVPFGLALDDLSVDRGNTDRLVMMHDATDLRTRINSGRHCLDEDEKQRYTAQQSRVSSRHGRSSATRVEGIPLATGDYCRRCGGSGQVEALPNSLGPSDLPYEPCPDCGGGGGADTSEGCISWIVTGILARLIFWVVLPIFLVLLAIGAYKTWIADDPPPLSGLATAEAPPAVVYSGMAVGGCTTAVDGLPTAIGCDQPHQGEVYHVTAIEAGPDEGYPGMEQFMYFERENCYEHFEEYVGRPRVSSSLVPRMIAPDPAKWESGERGVACVLLVDDQGSQTTGTLQGSG